MSDFLAEESRIRHLWLPLLASICLLAGGLLMAVSYNAHSLRSPTMLPTAHQGDVGFFKDVSDPEEIRHGDIIRFDPDWPETQGADALTFRAIALGGDSISGDSDGSLRLNGEPLDEPYLDQEAAQPAESFEVTVPTGRVFVVGDARSIANDSRAHLDDQQGTVQASSVSSRLVGIGWPAWHWSMPDTEHGVPLPFLLSSVLVAVGTPIILISAWRLGSYGLARITAARRSSSTAPSAGQ